MAARHHGAFGVGDARNPACGQAFSGHQAVERVHGQDAAQGVGGLALARQRHGECDHLDRAHRGREWARYVGALGAQRGGNVAGGAHGQIGAPKRGGRQEEDAVLGDQGDRADIGVAGDNTLGVEVQAGRVQRQGDIGFGQRVEGAQGAVQLFGHAVGQLVAAALQLLHQGALLELLELPHHRQRKHQQRQGRQQRQAQQPHAQAQAHGAWRERGGVHGPQRSRFWGVAKRCFARGPGRLQPPRFRGGAAPWCGVW